MFDAMSREILLSCAEWRITIRDVEGWEQTKSEK